MTAATFGAICRSRRNVRDNGRCAECGGGRRNWPPELTIMTEGELNMGKTIKEQIAEALAPVRAELEDREARVAVLEDQVEGLERRCEELRGVCKKAYSLLYGEGEAYANADDILPRIVSLQSEVAILRAEKEKQELGPAALVDLSAAVYRDALADFAIRVLCGGVAVSFREARP